MVRRSLVLGAALLLGAFGVRSTSAAPIDLSGNVEKDFVSTSTNPVLVTDPNAVGHAAVPTWFPPGTTTGMDIKDVRLSYDQASDTLSVGINFNGVAGDLDGNGTVGTVGPAAAAHGVNEVKDFSGAQTVALGLNMGKGSVPDIVVGIPVAKPTDPATGKPMTGVQAFTIAKYNDNPQSLPYGFGSSTVGSTSLLNFLGAKSVATSAAKPDVEFQLKDFTKLAKLFNPTFDPAKDLLTVNGFASDVNVPQIGKSVLVQQFKVPLAEQITPTPEPTTVLAWSAALGLAAAWRFRRARRAA